MYHQLVCDVTTRLVTALQMLCLDYCNTVLASSALAQRVVHVGSLNCF